MAENKKSPMKLGPAAALALAQGTQAGVQIFQGFQQRNNIKDDLNEAKTLADNRMRSYENFDFRIQNPYEDLTASTEAQALANQQQAQNQANILARVSQGATGAGAASLATAIARQGVKQAQAAQALTAKQEAANQRLAAGAQMKIDATVNAREQRRQEVLTSLALQDQAIQQQLLNDANKDITGGVGNLLAAGIEYAGGVEPRSEEDLSLEQIRRRGERGMRRDDRQRRRNQRQITRIGERGMREDDRERRRRDKMFEGDEFQVTSLMGGVEGGVGLSLIHI